MRLAAIGSNCIDYYADLNGGTAYPGGVESREYTRLTFPAITANIKRAGTEKPPRALSKNSA